MQYYPQKDPVIERDPCVTKMRLDVFDAMAAAVKQAFPEEPQHILVDEVKFVSFEDAIKELSEINQGKFV